jgi:N-acetyl-gamma-glutamyl-phosphate reductase
VSTSKRHRITLLHGASYVGGEIIRLLLRHPRAGLTSVTSRTFAGEPVWKAHPALREQTGLTFSEHAQDVGDADALLIAAEHGRSAQILPPLLEGGFEGAVVDLTADFRYEDPALYDEWFDYEHPAPELLGRFQYGLPEVRAPYPDDARWIANPGCFATGLALALHPLAANMASLDASVTALTGASGSGATPKAATHYPTRDGNVRAYKVMAHQHLPEVEQVLGDSANVTFAPASGPWTRGIWGTAHVRLPGEASAKTVADWYADAYTEGASVRLSPGALPEMRASVDTPFCDVGWQTQGDRLVVGFALDNLLKGAASQAVQNMNLVLGLPETAGLVPPGERAFAESAARNERREEAFS